MRTPYSTMPLTLLFANLIFLNCRTGPAPCGKDTDCKGERICVGGQCSEPARAAIGAGGMAQPAGTASPKSAEKPIAGEAESSGATDIDWIRAKYAEINRKSRMFRHVKKDLEGFTTQGGTLDVSFDGSQIAKLEIKSFGETFRVIEEYYYMDGEVIFVISKAEQYDGDFGPVSESHVDRLYFRQRKLIQWLTDGNKPVDKGDHRFAKQAKSTLEESDKYFSWAKDKRNPITSKN
jgi:hypothetical protein